MDYQLLETRLKDELKNNFENGNDYISASLLSLYWQQADNAGYKDESQKVVDFFNSMGFHTAVYPIPSQNSHMELLSRIVHLIKTQGKPGCLIVIHYGGHGDADNDRGMDREAQAVWAACLEGGPTVDWYEIQPHLHKCKADVLLLLDCCFSAQAARCRVREDPGKCELLAACAMRLKTPPPGPTSFTTALLREMDEMLNRSNQVATSHLAQRLTHPRAKLTQTPFHLDMSLGHPGRSIQWKSFVDRPKDPSLSTGLTSHLSLRVAMSINPDNQHRSLQDLIQWLKIEAPSFVQSIAIDKLLLQTEHLQQIMLGQDSGAGNSPLVQSLDSSGRQEVLEAWQEVDKLFTNISQTSPSIGELTSHEKVPLLKEKILHFVQRLEIQSDSVIQKLEAELVKLPDDTFEDVTGSSPAKALGLNRPLRLVRLIENPEPASGSGSLEINLTELLSADGGKKGEKMVQKTIKETEVLVEYMPYDESPKDFKKLQHGQKIQRLAQILNSDKPSEFGSLKCLHWFHDRYDLKYGLVFGIPTGLSIPYLTLLELLSSEHKSVRPTLGLRFQIAYNMGRAIQRWHSVEWVHEEICSANIIVFQNPDTHAWAYSRPFLGGFKSSRREVDFSNPQVIEKFETNVYRYPSRQNVPMERHDMSHDIYAYGVVLLEIGIWQPLSKHRYFEDIIEEQKLEKELTLEEALAQSNQIRRLLIKIANLSLGHLMGSDYRDAVLMCLGNELETREQPRLKRAFEANVLNQVAKGLVLK